MAPVVAVQGNMDSPEVRARLPTINTVQVGNWKIGVVHSLGMIGAKMQKKAKMHKLNVLVFGHLHRPSIKHRNSVLLINPGSPTNPMLPFITKPTVGLLRISEAKILPEIVQVG